ncbi:MAG: beta-ribofuranosylaminobenzene 5'-phosphate synthase family protein [Candidatus Dormibacteria bacterium]
MISVQAFGRLHFGLLSPEGDESGRSFGGVGLMMGQPDLCLHVEPSEFWSAGGPSAERALTFARRFEENSSREENSALFPPHRLRIERALPAHSGLGSGTQLALSVAKALALSWQLRCDLATLARRVGRGLRSALGIHGFEQGGFMVESGKRSADLLSPLVARQPFPESWRLVLAVPTGSSSIASGAAGLHGLSEVAAFAQLKSGPAARARTDALCRLVLLGMLPALSEGDVEAFGAALYEFNVRVGEAFAPVQGGLYASSFVAEMVTFLRGLGIAGVAQSSWGPAVVAVVGDDERAERVAASLRRRFALSESEVWVSAACNHGARVKCVSAG